MGDIFDLSGRVVAITGGLGQLGKSFALHLADAGARVAILDLTDDAQAIARVYGERATDPRLMFVAADVTDRGSLERALAAIEARWDAPFGLVNNAGLDSPPDAPAEENGPFETYPEASFDRVMEVNTKGVLLCCQVFGGRMAELGRGSIVNIGSIYGVVSPDQHIYEFRRKDGQTFFKPVAYSVSKSALYNLTRYLACYWGEKGVRVNILTLAGVFNNQPQEFLAEYCRKVPLARMARPGEYDGTVRFLMSDAASYVTGAEIPLDGGFTAW